MGYIQRWVGDGNYTAMSERDIRMGEWKYRRRWNMEVGRRRQTFKTAQYIYIYIYIYIYMCVCVCVCVCNMYVLRPSLQRIRYKAKG